MKSGKDEVMYIANLAKLKFTEEEAIGLTKEFEYILRHFDSLKETELEEIDRIDRDQRGVTNLREDEIERFEKNEELFSNVKDKAGEYVRIPKVID